MRVLQATFLGLDEGDAVTATHADPLSQRDMALFHYAISCALHALVSHAGRFGRGWYHISDGEPIIATEVVL